MTFRQKLSANGAIWWVVPVTPCAPQRTGRFGGFIFRPRACGRVIETRSLFAEIPTFADSSHRQANDFRETEGVAEAGHPPVQARAVGTLRRGVGDLDHGATCAHVAVLVNQAADLRPNLLGGM
jgi:hypothetical protein